MMALFGIWEAFISWVAKRKEEICSRLSRKSMNSLLRAFYINNKSTWSRKRKTFLDTNRLRFDGKLKNHNLNKFGLSMYVRSIRANPASGINHLCYLPWPLPFPPSLTGFRCTRSSIRIIVLNLFYWKQWSNNSHMYNVVVFRFHDFVQTEKVFFKEPSETITRKKICI